MSRAPSRKASFAKLDRDVLALMEDCRTLNLSTAIELLELVLAEIRHQAKESGPP